MGEKEGGGWSTQTFCRLKVAILTGSNKVEVRLCYVRLLTSLAALITNLEA